MENLLGKAFYFFLTYFFSFAEFLLLSQPVASTEQSGNQTSPAAWGHLLQEVFPNYLPASSIPSLPSLLPLWFAGFWRPYV